MRPRPAGRRRASRRVAIYVAAIAAAVALGLAHAPATGAESRVVRARSSPLSTGAFDDRAFGRALMATEHRPVVPMAGARVVIVPHHWPAGSQIAAALRDAAAGAAARPARRVVLLGPDHRKAGGRPAVSSSRAWSTPYGLVPTDAAAVAHIARTGLVDDNAPVLAGEHGIAGLVPAIAYFLPGARLVPVAVRGDARLSESARLASALAPLVTADTLVIVSADFAHDVSPETARRHDLQSLAALRGLDAARVRAFGDEHVDARGALAAAMHLARRLGASRFVLLERSDGSQLPGYAGGAVTSYITGYYAAPR